MPLEGAPSTLEMAPRYSKALLRIGRHSHLWVLCWLHKADRNVLRAVPRKISSALGRSGVFAMRSPDRPNPVSLSCTRLVSVRGNRLEVDALDVIDRTPVLDLKPYSPGIDSVPSASRPDFTRKYASVSDAFLRNTFRRIVRNHCGRLDRRGRAAVELVFQYVRVSGKAPAPGIRALRTNLTGDGLDALAALFGLRPSSGLPQSTGSPALPYWMEVTTGKKRRRFKYRA